MKKNNKIKKSVSVLAFLFVCALLVILSSCSDELDIQQSYPFKVETMPVPKDIVRGQTVEIRCELKAEGKFDGTIYTIRYFQHDGKGLLRMENGTVFQPNDRYLLENETKDLPEPETPRMKPLPFKSSLRSARIRFLEMAFCP